MKKKDNISNYIKSDLENREMTPSHDAWDRIQARMDVVPPVQQKSHFKWWLSVAAVALFTITTSVYIFINHQNEENSSEFVNNPVQKIADSTANTTEQLHDSTETVLANNEAKNSSKQEEVVQPKEEKPAIQKGKVQVAVNENTQQVEISLPKKSTPVAEKKEELVEDQSMKRSLVSNNNSDSIKTNKKKKNFVDPNMLLYSIENKENLKESNQSRVVSVGFK